MKFNENEYDKFIARKHISWLWQNKFITWGEFELLTKRTAIDPTPIKK